MEAALQEAKQKIDSLDMRMIIKKLVINGWKEDQAQAAVKQYKNLLYLWKKHADHTILPPSLELDDVWHTHILDTQKYHTDCNDIFGRYLHHYPYFGMDDKTDRNDLNRAFENTKKCYREVFGEDLECVRLDLKSVLRRLLTKH